MIRMNRWMGAAGCVALLGLTACGGGDSPRSRSIIREGGGDDGGGQAVVMKTLDPATAGSITGTVSFNGDAPKRQPMTMTQDVCLQAHTSEVLSEDYVINDGKVQWCFVYVDTPDSYPVPAEPAFIDQVGCVYRPHIVGCQANQTFLIKSQDATLHNFHYMGKANKEKNIPLMTVTDGKKHVFTKPEKELFVKCDVHSWMGAYIFVMTHPFYAVSNENGQFTINNVPPGTHNVVLWHEKLGQQSATVTVSTGAAATADFTLNG